MAMQNYSNNC
uniref:Uncharacterized protein n=1 Tax=Rhizophora mucronata TaxID=61149 RepID=A0A2P2PFB2_RHIMU